MKKLFATLALCAVTILPLAAQNTVKKTYTKAEYESCYRLFIAMGMDKSTETSVLKIVEMQTKNMPPQMQNLKTIVLDFYRKYISYDVMKKDYAELYLKYFTIQEIKELTKFYASGLGKKYAEVQPQLILEAMELGQRRAQEHMPELQQAIMAEVQKNISQSIQNNQQNAPQK